MSYQTQGSDASHQLGGHWEGDKWVVEGQVEQDANMMMGEAEWNNNLDWMTEQTMDGMNMDMNLGNDAMAMEDASMDMNWDMNANMNWDMNANMNMNMNAPQVDLSAYNNVTELPTETKMLGPDLSGIDFNQLDSKTFNLYNN